jgi:phage terminase Nu1 subunit (DNA packaging protein)
MATQSDCAIHLFISAQRFRDLVNAGVITRQAASQYNLDTVRKEALAHLRAQAAARGGGESLARERTLLARSQRELAQLKAGQLRGALVELEEVAFALENRYALVKERMLSIPGKCGDELANRARGDVIDILRREINEALDELSTPARLIEEAGGRPDNLGQVD